MEEEKDLKNQGLYLIERKNLPKEVVFFTELNKIHLVGRKLPYPQGPATWGGHS